MTETVIDDANGESGIVSKSVTVVPCGTLTAYLHDFKFAGTPGGHPDFETYSCGGPVVGLASATMPPGGVPTLASTTGTISSGCGQQISSAASFAQWFLDDPINLPITQTLVLTETSPSNYAYSNSGYFPIDGQGFGNDNVIGSDGNTHNYAFTTTLHTQFRFNVGQTITFTGSNDFWIYIDGRLAIDAGGVHPAATASLTLNNQNAAVLGLTQGHVYRLDFFLAQRHTVGSRFNLSTTMCLSDSH